MAGKELPKGSQYRYYVHPKDKDTNDALAVHFEESGDRVCSDGKKRFLFDTQDHNLIAYVQRSRRGMNLKFLVFIQEGRGKIRPWPFDASKPWQKPKRKVA
ncbi:MAG: hypothetical protein V1814_03415 [Candidatus Moraniibacteriota bacterium]